MNGEKCMMMEGETIFLRKNVCDKVDTKVSGIFLYVFFEVYMLGIFGSLQNRFFNFQL